jgi:hypothetical protein
MTTNFDSISALLGDPDGARRAHEVADALCAASEQGDASQAVAHRAAVLSVGTSLRAALPTARVQAALARFTPTAPEALPRGPGLYLITNDARLGGDGSDSYVGCAKALHARFWREDFGHLVANSTRSHLIIARPPFSIILLETLPETGLLAEQLNPRIARLEVAWFILLRGLGLEMVNSVGNLGRTSDGETQHIVAWDMDRDQYKLFGSQQDTARALSIPQGHACPVSAFGALSASSGRGPCAPQLRG